MIVRRLFIWRTLANLPQNKFNNISRRRERIMFGRSVKGEVMSRRGGFRTAKGER